MEKKTNFDYIHNMCPKELAEFLSNEFCAGLIKEQLLDWLLKERE